MRRSLLWTICFCLAATATARAEEWTPNAAMLQLYEKAKAEKEVTHWAPAAIEGSWVPEYFNKRFPGIEIKFTADLQGATKIIAEARAGRHSVDVWSFAIGGMIEVQKRGLLQTQDWQRYGMTKDNIFFDGQAAEISEFYYLALLRINGRQTGKRLVQQHHVGRALSSQDGRFVQ